LRPSAQRNTVTPPFARLLRAVRCAATALPLLSQATAPPQWQYSGEFGPEAWGRMQAAYALCDRGRRQSPIDIVATRKQPLPALEFQYRSAPLRIVNDGHTVRVRIANGSRMLIGRDSHTLQQFHFHLPGGDRVRGEEFPMSMHFLHKSVSGRLVSLVVLFRQGAENAALAALLPNMPARGQAERVVAGTQIDPTQLLPAARGYFTYEGSLTAPPCTEGVLWIVMKQPLEVSAAQLARLGQMFPTNARPVQPLHDRVVTESP
jgi:carbonic anhydrase